MFEMSIIDEKSNDLLKGLKTVEEALKSTESKIKVLVKKRDKLHKEKLEIKQKIKREEARKLQNKNWYNKDHPWMVKLDDLMKNIFKIDELRSYQLPTINAVMQKQCTIIIMPTGAGKSLCYQIPALLLPGVTLVISPLVSLMEDQVMGLKSLNIAADLVHSGRQQKDNTEIENKMVDGKLKLMYCSPEKLAKSKRFMSKLEKVYAAKKLALIAIDEVHCCSQWGHDFRQDYKFLGILRKQFPLTPILGLTATAPTNVLEDVQELLNMDGCLVFKAPLNRPNLFYEVKHKSNVHQEVLNEIVGLISKQFPEQSGIIYCLSIKDSIEVAKDLRDKGIKAKPYNAQLPPDERKKIHLKWLSREIHIIVATIAFGMGIDKPDVRFVIHHSISKSMESYYQESGRAGRDSNPAKCIAFFRLSDMFRLSCMVFSDRTGLEKLYGMVGYCIDQTRCRREVMAQHFEEDDMNCDKMCDSCKNADSLESTDVTKLFKLIYAILENASAKDERMTATKLLDTIQGKSHSKLRPHNFQIVDFSREKLEYILAFLLIESYLEEDFHFTPYTTISYLKLGSKSSLVKVEDTQVVVHLPSLRKRSSSIDLNLPKNVSTHTNLSPKSIKDKTKLKKATTEPPLKKIKKESGKITKKNFNESDSDSCEIVYTEIDSSFGKF